MHSPLRIIYMGTPEFAVPPLDILVSNGYQVVAVITAPDKPAGRGLQLQPSAVKEYALSKGIPVLQPLKLKDPAFIEALKGYNANLQIVVAFRMLPEMVWNMPEIGTFNLHASLLPDYRGAAPINRAIMNGETVTGITTFFLKHEIDTGDVLMQEKLDIGPDENAGELHDRMSILGAKLVLQTVQAIEADNIKPIPQQEKEHPKDAPKIFKEDGRINWDHTIAAIHNHIRGLSPYPAAWTMLDGKVFKIFVSQKESAEIAETPGTIMSDGKEYMKGAAVDGYIQLIEVQIEGKKKMGIKEFLRGYKVEDGSLFDLFD